MKATDLLKTTCPQCKKDFLRRVSDLRRGFGVTCSCSCGQKWRRQKASEQRIEAFWLSIEVSDAEQCWMWHKSKNACGYGTTSYKGVPMLAHRLAYLLTNGALPAGLAICHTCDNPACCNPAHLWPGTMLANTQDSIRKGRFRRAIGEQNGNAKLCAQQIRKIAAAHEAGDTRARIAREIGVSWSTIDRVIKGKHWAQRLDRFRRVPIRGDVA